MAYSTRKDLIATPSPGCTLISPARPQSRLEMNSLRSALTVSRRPNTLAIRAKVKNSMTPQLHNIDTDGFHKAYARFRAEIASKCASAICHQTWAVPSGIGVLGTSPLELAVVPGLHLHDFTLCRA